MMVDVPFPVYAPDQPALESGVTEMVNNVLAVSEQSYGPIPGQVAIGAEGAARAQGAASFSGPTGIIVTFYGDATKLYLWNGTAWVDASRLVGGPYATPAVGHWVFEQFNDFVYATNGVDDLQVFTISASSNFVAATVAPPIGRYLATVRNEFLFMAHISTDFQLVRWTSQFDSTAWVIGVDLSGDQRFANNGRITGLIGHQYVVVFQEFGITLGTFVGPNDIFQFDKVSTEVGCIVPGSLAVIEQTIIFLDKDGFYRLDNGQAVSPIGNKVIDATLWGEINKSYLHRCWSAFATINDHLYYVFSYPTSASSLGVPDKTLFYSFDTGRWTPASFGMDAIFRMASDLSVDLDTDIDVADQNLDGAGLASFDTEFPFGFPVLAGFDSNNRLVQFTGPNLEAELDTVEAQLAGGNARAFVSMVRPLVDGGTLSVKLGTRDRPNDAVSFGSYVAQNNSGECLFRSAARQHRARVKIAAGGTWSHAQGVAFIAAQDGDR